MYVHTSVARLCRIRLNRATSAYSSACQSCDSICVVSGFHVRPRCSTNDRETATQSASGHGGDVRAVRAGRAVDLAEVLGAARCGAAGGAGGARGRRAPCRASSASRAGRACGRASGRPRARGPWRRASATRARAAGSHTLRDGAVHHERVGEVVDVLAGAREVHELGDLRQHGVLAERRPAPPRAARLRRYSTALTSWHA